MSVILSLSCNLKQYAMYKRCLFCFWTILLLSSFSLIKGQDFDMPVFLNISTMTDFLKILLFVFIRIAKDIYGYAPEMDLINIME